MILDGKLIASEIYENLSLKIEKLEDKPCLWAILLWNDAVSHRYIGQKKKFAEKIWMDFKLFQFESDISEDDLKSEILKLNVDKSISWYIVQLPLPEHIDTLRMIRNIDPKKDVDGFHPENQGKIMIGDITGLPPCTPAGVMKIFKHYDIELSGKKICILGQSNIVWKPMAVMCINEGATVSSLNHLTPDISLYTKEADIIISATGQAHLISPEIVKANAIIVDVGFSVKDGKIYGDADFTRLEERWHTITPVPGGVGPMTVAMLLQNTYNSHIS